MTVAEFFRAIRKRWPVLAAIVAIGVALAALYTAQQTPKYQASVTFFVSTPAEPGSSGSTALALDQFTIGRVNSYIRLLSSDAMAQEVIHQRQPAGQPVGRADLERDHRFGRAEHRADEGDGHRQFPGAGQSDRRGDRHPARPTRLHRRRAGQDGHYRPSAVQLKVISGPTVGSAPVSPRKSLNYALGLLLGLVVGLIIIALRELTDTSYAHPNSCRTRPAYRCSRAWVRQGRQALAADRRDRRGTLAAGRGVPPAAHEPAVHQHRRPG